MKTLIKNTDTITKSDSGMSSNEKSESITWTKIGINLLNVCRSLSILCYNILKPFWKTITIFLFLIIMVSIVIHLLSAISKDNLKNKRDYNILEILDIKDAVIRESHKTGNYDWLNNIQNFQHINLPLKYQMMKIQDQDDIAYVTKDEIHRKHDSINFDHLSDYNGEEVKVYNEDNNFFSIEFDNYGPDSCKYMVKPLFNIKKITINDTNVDFYNQNDIKNVCSMYGAMNIKYYFNKE